MSRPEMRGSAIVARARACLGPRFRVQGRDPAHGLDCVGLAGRAFGIDVLPAGYALRGGDPARIARHASALGLAPVPGGQAREGALLLLATGPGQYHLAILTDGGFVHADARLGRVVETPGRPRWPVVGAWMRVEEGGEE